jgi:hypothetical protein
LDRWVRDGLIPRPIKVRLVVLYKRADLEGFLNAEFPAMQPKG